MAVESATYISQLNTSYPLDGDVIAEGDNHVRLVKSVLQGQFTSLGAAAVTVTAAQINDVVNKAPIASPTLTGTPAAPTASIGTSTTQLATTAFVQAAISTVSPQTSLTMAIDPGTAVTGVAGQHTICTNAATVTFTLPTMTANQRCKVTFANSLATNIVDPNGQLVLGVAGTRQANLIGTSVEFTYVNSSVGVVY